MMRLFKIAVLILINIFTFYSQPLNKSDGRAIYVYNIRSDSINISEFSKVNTLFVIFYNNYSCSQCFNQLLYCLKAINKHELSNNVILLMRSGQSIVQKREMFASVKRNISEIKKFYFDIHDDVPDSWPPINLKGGVFGQYNVSKTPSLLIRKPSGNNIFISYDSLFGLLDSQGLSKKRLDNLTKLIKNKIDD